MAHTKRPPNSELDAFSADREKNLEREKCEIRVFKHPTKVREEDEVNKKLTPTKNSPWPSYKIISKFVSTKEILLFGSLLYILLLIVYLVAMLLILTGPTRKQGDQGPTGPAGEQGHRGATGPVG